MRSVHALALPVALLLALGLSACGSGGQIPISEPTKSAGETTGSTDSTRRPTERPTERPTTRRPTERPTEPTPTATSSGGRFVHSTELQVNDHQVIIFDDALVAAATLSDHYITE